MVPDVRKRRLPVGLQGFQSASRFAVVPDEDSISSWMPKWLSFNPLQGSRWFQTRTALKRQPGSIAFQSASRFAVVPDPTPWHAVLTSPVAAVLHTTPPHPLQQADRTCPQWGKTPSQVPYTPEAVFGRSPTPLPEGVFKIPSRRELGVFVGFYLRWCRGLGWSFWGRVCRSAAGVVSTQPFASAHELAQPALRNLHHRLGLSASGRVVSTRAAPPLQPGSTNFKKHPSQPGSTDFKKLRRDPAQPVS